MTMAAGFICNDGIVICADSQETVGDFKWDVKKLATDNAFGFFPLIITGAGFGDAIDATSQRLINKLQGGFDEPTALHHISEILREVFEKDLQYYPAGCPGFAPLLG